MMSENNIQKPDISPSCSISIEPEKEFAHGRASETLQVKNEMRGNITQNLNDTDMYRIQDILQPEQNCDEREQAKGLEQKEKRVKSARKLINMLHSLSGLAENSIPRNKCQEYIVQKRIFENLLSSPEVKFAFDNNCELDKIFKNIVQNESLENIVFIPIKKETFLDIFNKHSEDIDNEKFTKQLKKIFAELDGRKQQNPDIESGSLINLELALRVLNENEIFIRHIAGKRSAGENFPPKTVEDTEDWLIENITLWHEEYSSHLPELYGLLSGYSLESVKQYIALEEIIKRAKIQAKAHPRLRKTLLPYLFYKNAVNHNGISLQEAEKIKLMLQSLLPVSGTKLLTPEEIQSIINYLYSNGADVSLTPQEYDQTLAEREIELHEIGYYDLNDILASTKNPAKLILVSQ